MMPGRKYLAPNANKPRYGFNGKENDNEVKGDGNQIDYGNRIYDSRLGRFLSVDPLQKNFPALLPYQFCGDNPIATIDLDGLEPVAINPGTKTLILVLQGYGGDPPDNNTQASNAAKTNPGLDVDMQGLGMFTGLSNSRPQLQVAVFASSTTENTKNDVLTSIKNFRSVNPDGQVIIIGHSQGGDNAIELLKENRDVKVDLLAIFDTQEAKTYFDIKGIPIITGIDDNNVYDNVSHAINFYQKTEAIGGETLDFKSDKTKGYNVKSPGSNHRSIDNDVAPILYNMLNLYLNMTPDGGFSLDGMLKNVKEEVEKHDKFDPAKSGSDNVVNGATNNGVKKTKSNSE